MRKNCPWCEGIETTGGFIHNYDCPSLKKEEDYQKTGWVCPKCGRGVSPFVVVCPCQEKRFFTT